ncbi:MAG: Do family serine endopeptidase [Rhizobiaceae bacterium]
MTNKILSKSLFLSAATAAGIASTLLIGSTALSLTPAYAEAVHVEAPKITSFADVVEAVSPAVVSVRVKAKIRPASNRGEGGDRRGMEKFGFDQFPDDHPLKKFFERDGGKKHNFGRRRDRNNKQRRGQRRYGMSQGSGFFISDDGYIVTNNHVVKGGSEFTIVLHNGDEIGAKLIGTDPKTDLAVLKVDVKQKFTYVSFSEKKSRVGSWVVAVGNPFGLGGTVTAGIISANGRDIGSGPYDNFIQIDAAVNKGNSGGPTFNLNGEVIGVNTAIFSPSGGNVGIAFAISASVASEVVGDLIKNGSVTRGWLGVHIQPVTKDIAESLGLKKAKGAIVADAQADSPATIAGIKTGDVILMVDDKSIKGPKALARIIAAYEPDDVAKLTVFRDGKRKVIDVKLGTFPTATKVATAEPAAPSLSSSVDLEEFGLSIESRGNTVIVADVSEDSAAARKGIQAGDVIVSVNGREAKSVNDVGRAVAQAMEDERKAILFQFKSGSRNRFIALPVSKGKG